MQLAAATGSTEQRDGVGFDGNPAAPVLACCFVEDKRGRVAIAAVEGAAPVGIQAIVKASNRHRHAGKSACRGQDAAGFNLGDLDMTHTWLHYDWRSDIHPKV